MYFIIDKILLLIYFKVLDVTPYASDEKVQQECSKYLKNKKIIGEIVKDNNYWQHKATERACKLLHRIIK